jgi:hypothetical protein
VGGLIGACVCVSECGVCVGRGGETEIVSEGKCVAGGWGARCKNRNAVGSLLEGVREGGEKERKEDTRGNEEEKGKEDDEKRRRTAAVPCSFSTNLLFIRESSFLSSITCRS